MSFFNRKSPIGANEHPEQGPSQVTPDGRYTDYLLTRGGGQAAFLAFRKSFEARRIDYAYVRWLERNGTEEQLMQYRSFMSDTGVVQSQHREHVRVPAELVRDGVQTVSLQRENSESIQHPSSRWSDRLATGIRYVLGATLISGAVEVWRQEHVSSNHLRQLQYKSVLYHQFSDQEREEFGRAMGLTEGKGGDFYFLLQDPESGCPCAIVQCDESLETWGERLVDRYKAITTPSSEITIVAETRSCALIANPRLKENEVPLHADTVDWDFDADQIPSEGVPVYIVNPLAMESVISDARLMKSPQGDCYMVSSFSAHDLGRCNRHCAVVSVESKKVIGYGNSGTFVPMRFIGDQTAHLRGRHKGHYPDSSNSAIQVAGAE